MEKEAEIAQNLLRSRLENTLFACRELSESPDSNYCKLKFVITSSITEGCNNSILLLGARGSGKTVLELVLSDLFSEYPDTMLVARLNGIYHSENDCAFKEISRQLFPSNHLLCSKMASVDDNSQTMTTMLREFGLAHKTIIFVLEEFDLFAQGKQRVLYSLLDAMQSIASQAVVVGISCRLDADQLLEKRIRSRFSHRKLLFLPPSPEETQKLFLRVLSLPEDSSLSIGYTQQFNEILKNVLDDQHFKNTISNLIDCDSTLSHLLRFLFLAVSNMDKKCGVLSLENFRNAISMFERKSKQECILDCSVLELYILVCMRRLETKEQTSYNFVAVMKEYKYVHDSFQTTDYYGKEVCLRAFEHLLQRELVSFLDRKNSGLSIEFRPVKLLISHYELHEGLTSYRSCPAILHKLIKR